MKGELGAECGSEGVVAITFRNRYVSEITPTAVRNGRMYIFSAIEIHDNRRDLAGLLY